MFAGGTSGIGISGSLVDVRCAPSPRQVFERREIEPARHFHPRRFVDAALHPGIFTVGELVDVERADLRAASLDVDVGDVGKDVPDVGEAERLVAFGLLADLSRLHFDFGPAIAELAADASLDRDEAVDLRRGQLAVLRGHVGRLVGDAIAELRQLTRPA